jgi:hypothetical protein
LLDSVAGCAVHSTLPAGVGYTSLEIKVLSTSVHRSSSASPRRSPVWTSSWNRGVYRAR